MSLINQVLQDLDRRHAGGDALPQAARSVPQTPPRAPRWTRALLAAVAGAAVAIAAALAWHSAQGSVSTSRVAASSEAVARLPPPAQRVVPAPPAPALAAAPVRAEPIAATSPLPAMTPASASAAPPLYVSIEPRSTGEAAMRALPAPPPPTRAAASAAAPATADDKLEVRLDKRVPKASARERAEAEYQRGLALHGQGRTQDAASAFAEALREDPRHAPARQALAIALMGESRLDEAQRLLQEGLELNPGHLVFATTLARVRADRHDPAGAIEGLAAALADDRGRAGGERADALALLATLQQRAGRHAEAVDNFAAALGIAPGSGIWWTGLGISLAATGRADSAREAFERARATDSLAPELARFVDERLRLARR